MPALENQRHELFAQALAKGMTADAAYSEAGYKPDRKNAARLTTNDDVRTRVAEIQSRAAARVEVTVAHLTERLLNIAAKGEQTDEAPMLSVARASIMDAAKLNGLITDKQDVTVKATLADLVSMSMKND